MSPPVRTLVLEANGYDFKACLYDTVFRGVLGIESADDLPRRLQRTWLTRKLSRQYEALSYVMDWRDAFLKETRLEVRLVTINNLVELARARRAIGEYPLLIILHSAAGDAMFLLSRISGWLRRRSGALVMFIGNEFDLMAEKINFIEKAGVDYICSQLPGRSARWLYGGLGHARVLPMPHALNPDLYFPPEGSRRSIDLGFVGALYDRIIGDRERTSLLQAIERHSSEWDLECDFRFRTMVRFEWAEFLRSCRGVVGAESGTYFLDKEGKAIRESKEYLRLHPEATFEEVFERVFRGRERGVSGKCISSRHFEPIGTKTCQVLLEGDYNGILRANEHYISVKKDLSNLAEAIELFKDHDARSGIVESAYSHVRAGHTYADRVRRLLDEVLE